MYFIDYLFGILFPEYEYLQFIWHGGEHLCAGLEFYESISKLENKYSKA